MSKSKHKVIKRIRINIFENSKQEIKIKFLSDFAYEKIIWVHELATKLDTLELTDKDGKPMGSRWIIKAIDTFSVDIYPTKNQKLQAIYIDSQHVEES